VRGVNVGSEVSTHCTKFVCNVVKNLRMIFPSQAVITRLQSLSESRTVAFRHLVYSKCRNGCYWLLLVRLTSLGKTPK
jgi:hypothetical protein